MIMSPAITRRSQSSGTLKSSSGRGYTHNPRGLDQSDVRVESNIAGAQCGNPDCGKSVKNGIECTHCKCWFHTACSAVDPKLFRSHRQHADKPWLCNKCLSDPLLRTVNAITSYYELQLSNCLVEISQLRASLESLKSQHTSLPSTPATRNKRPRIQDSPTQDNQAGQSSNDWQTTDLRKNHGNLCPPNPQNPTGSHDKPDVSTNAPSSSTTNPNKRPGQCNIASKPQEVNNLKNSTASGKRRETNSIICTKFPEPTGTTIAARREEELQHWNNLCKLMGFSITPISLTRLTRKTDSAHAGEPRLLRVTLRNMVDVETILLASHILKDDIDTRIHPDIPWSTRSCRKTLDPTQARAEKNARTILIHGIPELNDNDQRANHLHDCSEWSYIQSTLDLDGVLATDVYRLPRSPTYKGHGPCILKVTLLTETMLADTLGVWYARKHLLPEIRIRPHLPIPPTSIETSPATQDTPTIVDSSPNQPQNHSTSQTKPKNLPSPVNGRPASQ